MSSTGKRPDLDRLAVDEDERKFLLRSIDDLDMELAAGDIDTLDYNDLRANYSVRLAEVQRRIEGDAETLSALNQRPRSLRSRMISIGAGLATFGFALGIGLFVARSAGERKDGQIITGNIGQNAQSKKIAELMQTASAVSATDPLAAVEAYDEVIKLEPQVVAAWAYGGWTLRLTSLRIPEGTQRTEVQKGALRRLDEAVKRDPTYADAHAFRAIMRMRDLNDPVGAKADLVAMEELVRDPIVDQLTASLREELGLAKLVPATTVLP